MSRRTRAYVQLVAASATWGLSVTFTKFGVDHIAPVTLLPIELAAAALALWIALLASRLPIRVRARDAAALGALEPALAYLFITVGLRYTSGANGSVLTGLESCFAVVLAAVLLKERLSAVKIAAVVLALAGLLLVESAGSLTRASWGDLLVVLGVVFSALYVIVAKRVDPGSSALTLTTHQFTYALGFSVLVAVGLHVTGVAPASFAGPRYLLVAAATGIVGFGVSFLLYNSAIRHVSAGTAATVINLIPVFGVGGAVIVLGEPMRPVAVLGALLIGGAVVLFTRAESREAAPETGDELCERREPTGPSRSSPPPTCPPTPSSTIPN